MGEEPIIRGTDAHKIYNSGAITVHALRGVNLAIPRGEMVAIMGPSGCGKTTLLNCFSGLDDLTSGDVRIEGVSLAGMDDDTKSRYRSRRMGFVFQSYNLLPVLTAVENVELPVLVAKVPAKEARRKALDLMDQVEAAPASEPEAEFVKPRYLRDLVGHGYDGCRICVEKRQEDPELIV